MADHVHVLLAMMRLSLAAGSDPGPTQVRPGPAHLWSLVMRKAIVDYPTADILALLTREESMTEGGEKSFDMADRLPSASPIH